MKNNLLKAFALQLDYLLDLHSHIDNVRYTFANGRITVTIKANNMGTYHNLDLVYSVMNDNLQSYANIISNDLVISIF